MRLRQFLVCLCAAVALAAGPSAPDTQWTEVYTAGQLPDATGWSSNVGDHTRAEITDSGLLHIVDAGSAHTELHAYSRRWDARPETGAIAQATVKVVEATSRGGVCMVTADGVHEEVLSLYPDRAVLLRSDLEYEMDTTDDFHTYQVRMAGVNVELWIDGRLAVDGWGKLRHEAYHGRRCLIFGSVSSKAQSEAYWKDVRYMCPRQTAERVEGAEDVVIYRKGGVYACFPSMYRLDDGRIYARFGTRVRRSHIDNTGGSASAVSSDGGHTWRLVEEHYPDPRFVREDGARIVPHARAWIYADEEELPQIKKMNRKWRHVREGTVAYLGDPRVRITTPGGETTIKEFDSPLPGGTMSYHPACSFLRTGDIWMTAVYCFTGNTDLSGVWAIRSEDNGETWDMVHVAGPICDKISLGEAAVCENGDGEIIAMMRSGKGGTHNSYQCFSSDGGKTWSMPCDSGIWGYPSHLLLLEDGRMLCTYGYRRDAMGVRAVLSEDGGHTWDLDNEVVIRADGYGSGGDNGYPISMQMKDGHIFTIYYMNDRENVTHVAGTHWPLPEED